MKDLTLCNFTADSLTSRERKRRNRWTL